MSGSKEVLKATESVGAAVAMTAGAEERLPVKGHYRVELLRVKDEHRAEAEELSAMLRIAQEMKAEQEVARLVARLQAVPRYVVEVDEIHNVVTTVGKNHVLDNYLAGSAYTASLVMGLKGTGTAVAGDTMASHAGWLEVGGTNAPAYSGNRPTPSLAAASGGSKATASAVSFTFTSGGTVAGCFICAAGSSTKDNTTGTLLSAGDFSGGNKTVANTDVLNVTWSLAL